MKQIKLRVSDQVHREIKTVAAQTDQSMQDVVLMALRTIDTVDKYLAHLKAKGG